MKDLGTHQPFNIVNVVYGKYLVIFLAFLGLGGCGIWNGYLDPDYESSRAERLCHPYGDCSQGTWVAVDGADHNSKVEKIHCQEVVDQRYGNGWWKNSVTRGLEIGRCMEKKGYRLKQ